MKTWAISIQALALSSWIFQGAEPQTNVIVDEWIERPDGVKLDGVPRASFPPPRKMAYFDLDMRVKPHWTTLRISRTGNSDQMNLFNLGTEPLVYAVEEGDSNRWIWWKELGPRQSHLIPTKKALVYVFPIPLVKE
ncbi:hypothetical protein PSHT_12854 [Puccinia striiformis]|uniref:Uncharacterized protein n=3 Tax=Puccinia striiformis TaxID=27350 RepID=A0A0L0VZ88_9BASI|nr:hypothetical protein PSTG_02422 [Puccinia striiformis f. sp. tritici PST-78]POV98626.1 hypothetical protein PSTT_14315 [Puccinia striiformis]POW00763.1 hypothetical protein PSHT_12854 [Puccinia striiformis]